MPAIREFFAVASERPAWVDEAAVARGQQFFNRLVAHHFSALYLASLPSSYAAAKGVQVLRMTGRLQTDTERRLNETAQFLMDIAAPGAMEAGGSGIDRILHVRLMHAAVRWMIAHDPAVVRVDDLAPPASEEDGLVWSTSWGVPTNQEDLIGTWLTFTAVVYDAFDASGVDYGPNDVADHMHLWRLAAHHLGVLPELVPVERSVAAALRDRVWARQQGAVRGRTGDDRRAGRAVADAHAEAGVAADADGVPALPRRPRRRRRRLAEGQLDPASVPRDVGADTHHHPRGGAPRVPRTMERVRRPSPHGRDPARDAPRRPPGVRDPHAPRARPTVTPGVRHQHAGV